jgi:hypothetical protein
MFFKYINILGLFYRIVTYKFWKVMPASIVLIGKWTIKSGVILFQMKDMPLGNFVYFCFSLCTSAALLYS